MQVSTEGQTVRYESRRSGRTSADLVARYWPTAVARRSLPGTIEHWLTERYCLYSADARGRIFRGNVQHMPWPLQPADCEIEMNTLASFLGIDLPQRPELVHFAKRLDVVAWYLTRIR